MAKLTKKHYNRKLITFGVMLFIAIALISTGFAAFVISADAENKETGNISVGKLTESSLAFQNVKLDYDSFLFEPEETDVSGRVRNDGVNFERLSVTISGEITNANYLDKLTIELKVSDSVKAAAEAGYIVLPTCVLDTDGEAKTIITPTTDTEGKTNVVDFTYTITFEWGVKFNGQNPGDYYDTDPAGMLIEKQTMIDDLKALRMTMYGLTSSEQDIPDGANIFEVQLVASANK